MKALVVYYSMSGNTKRVAKMISAETGADLLALHPVKNYPDKGMKKYFWGGKSAVMGEKPKLQPYIFNASKYDAIIFGCPIWASSFAPPLRTFIEENREALEGKKVSAFMCFMGGGDKKAFAKLRKFLKIENLAAELVLNEPKAQANDFYDAQIKAFCAKAVSE